MLEKSLIDLEYNIKSVFENVAKAAIEANRNPKEITLLAATKTVSVDVINQAISFGIKSIGENRVQELISKYNNYNLKDCDLHFIGHLQTNKVKQIISKVKLIHSVDSEKLATEISNLSLLQNTKTEVLVEVNIGKEKSKSGVSLENLTEFLHKISILKGISVKGLMTIPPMCENSITNRRYLNKIRNLFIDIYNQKIDNIGMDILSMGMSNDYYDAILEGSTMIRVGSAIFGLRS